MYKRLVVKIGSNVLAGPGGLPDEVRMEHLVAQIASVKASGSEVVVVSSGAVASGRAVVPMPGPGQGAPARLRGMRWQPDSCWPPWVRSS